MAPYHHNAREQVWSRPGMGTDPTVPTTTSSLPTDSPQPPHANLSLLPLFLLLLEQLLLLPSFDPEQSSRVTDKHHAIVPRSAVKALASPLPSRFIKIHQIHQNPSSSLEHTTSIYVPHYRQTIGWPPTAIKGSHVAECLHLRSFTRYE